MYSLTVEQQPSWYLWLDGKLVLEYAHGITYPDGHTVFPRTKPVALQAGREYDVKIECYGSTESKAVAFAWVPVNPATTAESVFSARLSPLNFGPMVTGAPDQDRAQRMLTVLKDEQQFWGPWVCPVTPKDDPAYPEQVNWRGKIWPPTNYLLWLGLKRYAEPALLDEYAAKSVALFMRQWNGSRNCCEGFLGDGTRSHDPHYTWGALLCLIGIESLCDITPDGKLAVGSPHAGCSIRNWPFGGDDYDLSLSAGHATVTRAGRTMWQGTVPAKVTLPGRRPADTPTPR